MRKKYFIQKKRRFYINENIRAKFVKLIDENGQFSGDIPTQQALNKARESELDLVLIGPDQDPPVAKILDFGKFLYEQDRKERKNRASSKDTEVKEIRLSFNLSDHDREVKIAKAREFLDKGHRVKVHLRLKGRENAYPDKAFALINEFSSSLNSEFEQKPTKLGSVITSLLKK